MVAILLLLAGLLLPVISRARTYARKMAAKTEVKQIETAWSQYLAEYQTWPSNYCTCAITNEVLWILEGSNIGNANPKNISFMHFTRCDAAGNPVSPWGKATAASSTNYYYCTFDADYDNIIPAAMPADALHQPTNAVNRSVIVWTINKDVQSSDPDYIIGSWKE